MYWKESLSSDFVGSCEHTPSTNWRTNRVLDMPSVGVLAYSPSANVLYSLRSLFMRASYPPMTSSLIERNWRRYFSFSSLNALYALSGTNLPCESNDEQSNECADRF